MHAYARLTKGRVDVISPGVAGAASEHPQRGERKTPLGG